ncbi:unnamed protein product [Allacma fusca]|uniref:Uncharacterized protein n=1 Tax=Allacma fusca TaxID=39272 RepID=A0A8J2J056_9HEXA|nr:unnamed protein product [Allacma fusca]
MCIDIWRTIMSQMAISIRKTALARWIFVFPPTLFVPTDYFGGLSFYLRMLFSIINFLGILVNMNTIA